MYSVFMKFYNIADYNITMVIGFFLKNVTVSKRYLEILALVINTGYTISIYSIKFRFTIIIKKKIGTSNLVLLNFFLDLISIIIDFRFRKDKIKTFSVQQPTCNS